MVWGWTANEIGDGHHHDGLAEAVPNGHGDECRAGANWTSCHWRLCWCHMFPWVSWTLLPLNTLFFSSVTCCPSSPVCTNSVADCLYQGARFLEWEKVMHLLPAYEAGGEEDGSLVVRGYDHMHMQPMVRIWFRQINHIHKLESEVFWSLLKTPHPLSDHLPNYSNLLSRVHCGILWGLLHKIVDGKGLKELTN